MRRSRSSSRPQSAATRRRISPAALRVNVRARTREGDTPSTSTRCAMRAVSACVLPVPAAAQSLAEAAALVAGAAGMTLRDFFLASASGNALVALAWSVLGAAGQEAGSLPMAILAALVLPVALVWLVVRRQA